MRGSATSGDRGRADQVKPTSRTKCPTLRWATPPPAQCTMDASKMMARITTTTQKKNTTMPGMAYPATVLALATATSYPPPPDLFGGCLDKGPHSQSWTSADGFGSLIASADRPVRSLRTKSGRRMHRYLLEREEFTADLWERAARVQLDDYLSCLAEIGARADLHVAALDLRRQYEAADRPVHCMHRRAAGAEGPQR